MPTPRLVPVAPTQGEPIPVDRSPFWIGSASSNALRLYLPSIGERHASLTEREDGYYLSPFREAMAVRVDGRPISGPTKLADGVTIELASAARYEFVTGAPRAQPVPEAQAEPQYETGPAPKRRWWRRRRRGPKKVGFPVWAFVAIGLLAAALIYGGVVLFRAVQAGTEVVEGPPALTPVEGQIYDSLMADAGKSIERGSTLLELGLNQEALQEFGRAVSVFDGSPLAGNSLVRPSIEALFSTVTRIYQSKKFAVPAGFRAAKGKVADLSTALAQQLTVDQFQAALDAVQTAFQTKFTRRYEITGADHAEHVSLYGKGGARDIRVRDLTGEQIDFLISGFAARGARVKDFSKDAVLQAQIRAALARGWSDRAGTGLHLHVDRFRDRRDQWTVTK